MEIRKDISEYMDIIDRERPDLQGHHRMSELERAAQFSPFAALTGFDVAIEEVTAESIEERSNEIELIIPDEVD